MNPPMLTPAQAKEWKDGGYYVDGWYFVRGTVKHRNANRCMCSYCEKLRNLIGPATYIPHLEERPDEK